MRLKTPIAILEKFNVALASLHQGDVHAFTRYICYLLYQRIRLNPLVAGFAV